MKKSPVLIEPWLEAFTAWDGIDANDLKDRIISVKLRDENNLIKLNWNNELYCDLQLPNGLKPTDTIPVWRTVGRVLANDGWIKTWTLICEKTTSGDMVQLLYADDGTIWINRGNEWVEIIWDSHRDIIAITYPSDAYHYDYDYLNGYDQKIKIWKFKTVDGENITQLKKWDIVSFVSMDEDVNNSKSWEIKVEEKVETKELLRTMPHGMDNRISIYANDADPEDSDVDPIQVIYLAPFWWLWSIPSEMQTGYDDSDLTLLTNATIQTWEIREWLNPITNEKCLIYMMWNCGRTYVGPYNYHQER